MEYTITKRYARKISINYQSYDFSTELTKTVDVKDGEELLNETTKLFQQAKGLTETDIESCRSSIIKDTSPE